MVPKFYIPMVEDLVELRTPGGYAKAGVNHMLQLRVTDVPGFRLTEHRTVFIEAGVAAVVHVEVLRKGEPTGRTLSVEIEDIKPPSAWKPTYPLTVHPETAESLRDWLASVRGVRVWGKRHPGFDGPLIFTPGDGLRPNPCYDWSEIIFDPDRLDIKLVKEAGPLAKEAPAPSLGAS